MTNEIIEKKSDLKLSSEKQAAAQLGVSRITLQRKRKSGEITFYQVGGRVLYSNLHLQDYLAKCEQRAGEGGEK